MSEKLSKNVFLVSNMSADDSFFLGKFILIVVTIWRNTVISIKLIHKFIQ